MSTRTHGYNVETFDPDVEPEYVGAHSGISADECQHWFDAEPDSERFVPTKCGNDPTHTIIVFDGTKVAEIASCDEHGEPDDLPNTDRIWTGQRYGD